MSFQTKQLRLTELQLSPIKFEASWDVKNTTNTILKINWNYKHILNVRSIIKNPFESKIMSLTFFGEVKKKNQINILQFLTVVKITKSLQINV